MAKVRFFAAQRSHTEGNSEFISEASNYLQLRQRLVERFPSIPEQLLDNVIVAIDGVIVQRPFNEAIGPDSEVIFIGQIGGG